MKVRIKFRKLGANSVFGSFAPGEVRWCDEDMARHLVHEADVAKYVDERTEPPAIETAAAPADVEMKTKVRKAKK